MNEAELFRRSVRRYRDKVAAIDSNRGEITYKHLGERVNRLTNGLVNLGLRKGDRMCILMKNGIPWIELQYACGSAGIIRSRLNIRDSIREYLFVINDVNAKCVVFDQSFWGIIDSNRSKFSTVEYFICVADQGINAKEINSDLIDYESLILNNTADEPEIIAKGSDINTIWHTSGTSGNYKGAVHTHDTRVNSTVRNLLLDPLRDIKEDDVFIHVAPLTHMSGCFITPTLIRGVTNVILKEFKPELFLEVVEKYHGTMTILAPTIIASLLTYDNIKKYDYSSLRNIFYAASPIAQSVIKKAIDTFGQIFYQGYGTTEAVVFVTGLEKSDHRVSTVKHENKKLLSCGRVLTSVEVRLVNNENQPVKTGENGEVVIRGDNVCIGYWHRDEDTAIAFDSEGWFHTADIGRFDEEGYLYIVDRKQDMIISGGLNVYPREVEDVISDHSAVFECAVIGVPDEYWGENVKAIIVLKAGMKASEEEIIDHCVKSGLGRYKKPKIVQFVDELPKTPSGKILRRALRGKL